MAETEILETMPATPKTGLIEDAPGVDTVNMALEARSQAHGNRSDLEWLMGTEEVEPEESEKILTIEDGKIPTYNDAPLWQRVGRDVGRGLAEAPRQALGGIMDAVDSTANFLESIVPLGGIQIFDEEGNLDIERIPPEKMAELKAAGKTAFSGLTPDDAESVTGNLVRNVAQFLGPFAVASKAVGSAQIFDKFGKLTPYAKAATAGAIADFFAFEGNEQRVSDLVESVPALKNPVTAYLAADETDSDIEGRLKNAIEGLGLGTLSDTLFASVRMLRSMRKARVEAGSSGVRAATAAKTAGEDTVARGAADMNLLGNAADDAPLMVRDTSRKLQAAVAETATGVPDDVAARSLTQGLTPLGEGSDVYVNWAKINTPDDIKQIIDDTATAMRDSVDTARRGVRTNVETVMSAEKVDAWDTLVSRRTGQALNAEQSVAARQLWSTAADKLQDVAKLASNNPSPENLYQFRRMLALFHSVQKEVISARTEVARALQSWSIPVGGSKERMRDINEILTVTGGSDVSRDMAERIAALSGMPEATRAISEFAEKSVYAKTRDAVQEYWINALLSGPKTHLVNAMSNSTIIGLTILERKVASVINRTIGVEAGVEAGEAMAQVHGVLSGFGDALSNAYKTMRTGQTGYGVNKIEVGRTRSLSSTAWNVRSDSWTGKAIDTVGSVLNVPGRSLQTADEFFKTLGYRMELHAQAHRQAVREMGEGAVDRVAFKSRVAEIVASPPESIRMEAAYQAAYQTFTNQSGKFAQGVSRILHKYPEARFIVPFLNTPANILSFTFERTPLAPITSRFRNAIAEGGAKADVALARMAVGTMSVLYAVDMGMRGQVTGSGPDKTSEVQNWRRQGFQPYSVKIGDRWVAYNRMDPLGFTIGIGADIAEYVNNAEGDSEMAAETQEAISAAVFSIAENITSKSYMQGFAFLMEAISEPDRFAPYYFERLFGSFVPSGAAEIARQMDPKMRVSHDIITALKRRTPGFSDELPPRLDLWGREISYESGLGKLYDTISPLYVSQYDPQPIDLAMERDGWFAGMPSKSLTVDGERIGLKNRPEIYARYIQLQGATKPEDIEAYGLADKYGNKTLLEVLNDVVAGKSYLSEAYEQAEDPEEKRDVAMRVVNGYRRAARRQLMVEFPELTEVSARKKAVRIERSQERQSEPGETGGAMLPQ